MHVSSSMRIVAAPGVTVRMVGGQAVLLNAETRTAFGLDPVGTRMWTVLNGAVSIQAALESLLTEYDVGEAQLQTDMDELIDRLQQHGLIEVRPAG